jgi:hypothetical protein
LSTSDATQASRTTNYQDDVNVNVNREYDLDAMAPENEPDEEIAGSIQVEPVNLVKTAIQKVFLFDFSKNDFIKFY